MKMRDFLMHGAVFDPAKLKQWEKSIPGSETEGVDIIRHKVKVSTPHMSKSMDVHVIQDNKERVHIMVSDKKHDDWAGSIIIDEEGHVGRKIEDYRAEGLFNRKLYPYLSKLTNKPLEFICLVEEPNKYGFTNKKEYKALQKAGFKPVEVSMRKTGDVSTFG